METQVLKALNFSMTIVTPFFYLERLCDAALPLPPVALITSNTAAPRSHDGKMPSTGGTTASVTSQTPPTPPHQLRSLVRYISELNMIEPVRDFCCFFCHRMCIFLLSRTFD